VRWFAIRVPPQKEFAAEALLREAGFRIFIPIGHRVRAFRRTKRKVVIGLPKLTGFLFVGFEFDEEPPWLTIMRYAIVQNVFTYEGVPRQFSENEMVRIFGLSQHVVPYSRPRKTKRHWRQRNAADIIAGPFQGRKVRMIELMSGEIEALYEIAGANAA
jgi:transcription antitermination factor NusG